MYVCVIKIKTNENKIHVTTLISLLFLAVLPVQEKSGNLTRVTASLSKTPMPFATSATNSCTITRFTCSPGAPYSNYYYQINTISIEFSESQWYAGKHSQSGGIVCH